MPQNPIKSLLFVSEIVVGPGLTASPQPNATGIVTISLTPIARNLILSDVINDNGLPLSSASASGSSPGITRTAGTSIALVGPATSGAQTQTTKMLWGFNLPQSYVAGAAIPVNINCVVTPALDVTAASTTMTVAAYSVVNGVETALTVSAAQQIPLTTAGTLTFSVTGTGLTPGEYVELELTMAVTTTSGGASTGQVNSVSYTA